MKKIPYEAEVRRALLAAKLAVRKALKGANQVAGQVLAKGKYVEAEALVERARRIQEFEGELESLRKRWRGVRQGARPLALEKQPRTPLWAYYQPVLRALAEAGGECSRKELEPAVERALANELKPGDRKAMAGGRELWQVMILRARKHLVAEGWVEDRAGANWKITAAGRKAAGRAVQKSAGLA